MNLLELAQKAFYPALRGTAQAATTAVAPATMPIVSWLMPPSSEEAEGYKTINRAVGAPQQALFKFAENPEEGLKPAIDYAFNYVGGKEPRISGRDLLKTRGVDLDTNPSLPGEFVAAGLDVLADPILLAGEAVSGAKKLAGIKETDKLLRNYFVKEAMKRPGAVETLTEFFKPNQLVKAGEDVRLTLEPAFQEFKNTLKKSGILDALEKKIGGRVIKETLIPTLEPGGYHVFGGLPIPEIPKNLISKLKISAADLANLKAGALDKVNPALITELTKVGIIKPQVEPPKTEETPMPGATAQEDNYIKSGEFADQELAKHMEETAKGNEALKRHLTAEDAFQANLDKYMKEVYGVDKEELKAKALEEASAMSNNKVKKGPRTLTGEILARGGLDPAKLRKDYNIKHIKESGLGHILKKGGQGLDDIAGQLETEGLIQTPIMMNPGDHLIELLKDKKSRSLQLESSDAKIDREYREFLKKHPQAVKDEGVEFDVNKVEKDMDKQKAIEINDLLKRVGKSSVLKRMAAKKVIRETTGQIKVGDLIREDIALKEGLRKEAAGARKAYSLGKKEGTLKQKVRQAEITARLKEREALRGEVNKMISEINALPTQSLPLEYKDKIEEFKSGFDLKKRTPQTIAKRESMRQFIERMTAEGKEIPIPQEKLDFLEKVTLNDMTVSELHDIHETVMRLYHQGRIKNKLLTSSEGREFGDVVKDGVNAITKGEGLSEESSIIRALRNNSPSWQDKSLEAAKWYVAIHLRPERICNMLDGWKEGINTKTMFVPLLNAENFKLDEQAVSLKRLVDIHKDVKIPDLITKQYDIGRFKGMTKDTAMFIYANSFNDANRAHLYGSGIMDSDIEDINKFLAPEERQAVENLIRYYDTEQWPALDKIYSELEGAHVGKEENYFPIMNLEEVTSTQEIAMEILARAHVRRAGVSQGFTKERVTSSKGFERFSYFETILRNWSQVEHYKAFAKPIRDVTHYLYNPDIKGAIKQKYGEPVFSELDKWVKDVSYGMNRQSKDALDKMVLWVRTNYATAVLGFNLLSMIKQPVSFMQGIAYVGERAAISGTLEYISNPIRATKIVYDKSPMMRNRAFTQERELREILQGRGVSQKLGQIKWTNPKELYQVLKEWGMAPLMLFDQIACVPLWMGAYRDIIRTGRIANEVIPVQDIEKRARAYADEVVRKTQAMGGILHLPGVFRGGNFQQLYTLFKNSLNQTTNMVYETNSKFGKGPKNARNITDIIKKNIWIILMPALVIGMISRKKLPTSAKEFFKNLASDTFDQTAGGFIILGQLASAFTQQYAGMNPLDSAVQDMTNLAKSKKPMTFAKNVARIAGKATGLPYVAAERAVSGRWLGGKAENKSEIAKLRSKYGLDSNKVTPQVAELRKKYGLSGSGSSEQVKVLRSKYGLS